MKTKFLILSYLLSSSLSFAQCPPSGHFYLSNSLTIEQSCSNVSTDIIDVIGSGFLYFKPNYTFNNNGVVRVYDTGKISMDNTFYNAGRLEVFTNNTGVSGSSDIAIVSTQFNNAPNGLLNNNGYIYSGNSTINNEGVVNNHSTIVFFEQNQIVNNKSGAHFNNLTPIPAALGSVNYYGPFHNFAGAALYNAIDAKFQAAQFINEGVADNYGIFEVYKPNNSVNAGTFNNLADGSFRLRHSVTYSGSILNNTGIFNNDGNFTTESFTKFINNGTFNRTQPGGKTLVNTGTFINNNTLYDADGSSTTNNGVWGGNSIFHEGSFINAGTLNPGDDGIGTYHFNNAYTHQNTANANFEIGGSTNYDRVTAGAAINLNGGTLNINFVNGYAPTTDEDYSIMTAASGVSGTFTTVNFPADYQDHMKVTYLPNAVVVNYSTTTLSTNDVDLVKNEFQLFPNPASKSFQLKTPTGFKFRSLKIVAVNGKILKQFSSTQNSYNISNLAKGVYFVLIEGSASQKLKLIKH